MRATLVSLLVVFCAATPGMGQKRDEPVKWEMGFLDKTFGIKFKSGGPPGQLNRGFKMVFEFTRDLKAPELAELRRLLQPPTTMPPAFFFYSFDDENIAIEKLPVAIIEGELTGVKGDRFRLITAEMMHGVAADIRKVEARPAPPAAVVEEKKR